MTHPISLRDGSTRCVALATVLTSSLIFAACSTGGVPAPTGTTPANTTPIPTASLAAPTPTAAAPTSAIVTAPPSDGGPTEQPEQTFHGATDLEALIPDEVRGMTLQKSSFSGQQYLDLASGGLAAVAQQINDFLTGLGRSIDDVSAATASGFGEGDYVNVTATQVAGADAGALLAGLVQVHLDGIPLFNSAMSGTATQLTLGGKNVTLVTTMWGGGVYDESYYYGVGDIVFRMKGQTEETVADLLSLLP